MPDALDYAFRGRRTLIETIQRLAEVHPDKVYVKQPIDQDVSHGFRDVTVLELLQAVDAFAWWLECQIGRSEDENFETIAFLGVNDVRWSIVFYGAIKCGYKTLFLSSMNTVDQNISLFLETHCSKFLCVPETRDKADELSARTSLVILTVRPLEGWLSSYSHSCPFTKSYEECKWDSILVLHSSGTTGNPKPIVINSGYFAAHDRPLPNVPGRRPANVSLWDFENAGQLAYSPFPSSHLAGVHTQILNPTFTNSIAVLGPPTGPPNASIMRRVLENCPLKILYSPPALIEEVANSPGGLQRLAGLDVLVYAGGPLAKSCGEALKNDVSLAQICMRTPDGCTETGIVPTLVPHSENWETLEFHPDLDYRMNREVEDAYEMVLPENCNTMAYTGHPWTFPGSGDWHTADLFTSHEAQSSLWQFYGRTNDIINLSDGTRFNPGTFEKAMLDHPSVSGALVVGTCQPMAAMLLEPRTDSHNDDASSAAFLDSVWDVVKAMNERVAPPQRISRDMLRTVPSRGLVRTPKGTIVRGSSIKKFQKDIEALYIHDS